MEPFYNKVLRMYTIATQRSSSAEVKDDIYSYTVAVESCTDASSKRTVKLHGVCGYM